MLTTVIEFHKLWIHENTRVYADRLICDVDWKQMNDAFGSIMKNKIGKIDVEEEHRSLWMAAVKKELINYWSLTNQKMISVFSIMWLFLILITNESKSFLFWIILPSKHHG